MRNDFIDPRTGSQYGEVPEHEIQSEHATDLSIAAMYGIDVEKVSNVRGLVVPEELPDGPDTSVLKDIAQVFTVGFAHGKKQSESLMSWARYAYDGESSELDNAKLLSSEAVSIQDQLPERITDRKAFNLVVQPFSDMSGQLYDFAANLPSRISGGAKQNVYSTNLLNPMRSVQAAIGAVEGPVQYMVDISTGELMQTLTANSIDFDVASSVAQRFGGYAGSVDTVGQLVNMVTGGVAGTTKGLALRASLHASGVAIDGTAEATQQVIGNIALIYAKNIIADRDGGDHEEYSLGKVFAGSGGAFVGGASAAAGVSTVSAVTTKVASKVSPIAIKYVNEYAAKAKRAARDLSAQRMKVLANEESFKAKDSPTMKRYQGESAKVNPILPQEAFKFGAQEEMPGAPSITDEVIELSSRGDNVFQEADKLVSSVDGSSDSLTADFQSQAAVILGSEEQASAVIDIIDSRARASGITTEEFMRENGDITLESDTSSPLGDSINGTTIFLDTKTVIVAFKNANISTLLHEISHVFRRDLGPGLTARLDRWAGVKDGAAWDAVQEERFARGFERYLIDGTAKSKTLTSTFARLKRWMLDIYKNIDSSSIREAVSPELRSIFDDMLSSDNKAQVEVSNSKADLTRLDQSREEALIQEELQKEISDLQIGATTTKKKASLSGDIQNAVGRVAKRNDAYRATKEKYIRRIDDMEKSFLTEGQRDRFEVAQSLREMNNMFHLGNVEATSFLKAKLKATLARIRSRSIVSLRIKQSKKRLNSSLSANVGVKNYGKLGYDERVLLGELRVSVRDITSRKAARAVVDTMVSGELDLHPDIARILGGYASAVIANNRDSIGKIDALTAEVAKLVAEGSENSFLFKTHQESAALIEAATTDVIGPNRKQVEILSSVKLGPERSHRLANSKKTFKESITTGSLLGRYIYGIGGLLNLVSSYAENGSNSGILYKTFNFFNEETQQKRDILSDTNIMNDRFAKSFGIVGNRSYVKGQILALRNKHLLEWVDVGLPEISGAKQLMSPAAIRYVWGIMQNEKMSSGGAGSRISMAGYTLPVQKKIDTFMADNPGHKAFALAMGEFYNSDSNYNRNNEVFSRLTGFDMPRETDHVPIRSSFIEALEKNDKRLTPKSQMAHDAFVRKTPESTGRIKKKSRSARSGIVVVSDWEMFGQYSNEMAHYRAFAEKSRLATAVFDDNTMKSMVTHVYGPEAYTLLKKHINSMASDGITVSGRIPIIDKVRSNVVSNKVALSVGTYLKQYISTLQYSVKMPFGKFVSYLADVKRISTDKESLLTTAYMETRGIDPDFTEAGLSQRKHSKVFINPAVTEKLSYLIQKGDKGAIGTGGAALLRYYTDDLHVERSEAIRKVLQLSDSTQQSSNTSQQSMFTQEAGSIARLGTAFSSAQRQATQQVSEGFRDLLNATTNSAKASAIKKIAMFHIVIPGIFSIVTSIIAGDESDDAVKNALFSMAAGPISTLYSGPRLVTEMIKRLIGLKSYMSPTLFASEMNSIYLAASHAVDGSLTLDDSARAIETLLTPVLPTGLVRMERIVSNAASGNIKGAVFGSKQRE